MERKKRVGFITSSPILRTGFSRNAKALLTYLYKNRPDYDYYFLHQGIFDGEPNLQKMPFNNWGALTQDILNGLAQKPPQERESWERLASYGNLRVEDFVIKNELDVVFHIEDIWSSHDDFYWKKDWYSHVKDNFVQWTTLDSLPIINQAKVWAEKTPNFWTWASFAEEAMKEEDPEKFANVKTVHGCLDTSNFKPLPVTERVELRKRFNIDPKEKVILYLGRNQLRKLFLSNMEALVKFKKQHPDKKTRLLFHCSWSEGWNLQEAMKEFGLAKEDVLTTYNCGQCKFWHVMPFEGEGIDCPHCQAQKSFSTCGIHSTVTEKDLAKIYGISDAASSMFTSGGLEYFNVESLLCGLPLLTTPYSSGLDFARQPFVESVEGGFYRECNTNFLKFNPNPNSISKFFLKIHEMSPEKYRQISQDGRAWALKTFDVSVISKKVESFIDSCKMLNWADYLNFKKDYDSKVPNAEVNNNIADNKEWLKELYSKILKMDVKDDDSGLIGWVQSIDRGTPRAQIEHQFRNIAFQENQKNNTVDFKTFIDMDRENKRGIIVVKESGGDIFIATSLFKDFHTRYPKHDLYVMCDNRYADILAGNPHVHKILPYFPPAENEMYCIGSGTKEKLFDVFFYPGVSAQKFLNYLSHTNNREVK